MVMAAAGEINDGFDSFFKAEKLNPFHESINYCIAFLHNYTGDYTKALEYINKNISICPTWNAQYLLKMEVLCKLKYFDEVEKLIEDIENTPQISFPLSSIKAYFYTCQKREDSAKLYINTVIDEINRNTSTCIHQAYYICHSYLIKGDVHSALDLLKMGIKYKATPFLFLLIDNNWDAIKENEVFKSIVAKLSLTVTPEYKESSLKYKKSILSETLKKDIKDKLVTVMDSYKPYLDPHITLPELAELMDTSPNILSQYINSEIGKNYYDFINSYRLNHFLSLQKSIQSKTLSILGNAYESGFNSKTTFNQFFRKTMGTTPSRFLKKHT